MVAPSPETILAAVKATGVKIQLTKGWDDPSISAPGVWLPGYVVMHDTGTGVPASRLGNLHSLPWMIRNNYFPIRAAHFLVGRDGTVAFVYAFKDYHAGKGGPYRTVPQDAMNSHAFGIEIESQGENPDGGKVDDLTPAQVTAAAKVAAALCRVMGVDESRVLNHKTWAPGRKSDTAKRDSFWQQLVAAELAVPKPTYVTIGGRSPLGRTVADSLTRLSQITGMSRARIIWHNPWTAARVARPGDVFKYPAGVKAVPIHAGP